MLLSFGFDYVSLSPLPPPKSTLFPYTTLFRSRNVLFGVRSGVHELVRLGLHRAAVGRTHHEVRRQRGDRKSTRLNSSHLGISYAVFCLKKKKQPMTKFPGL